MVIVPQLCIGDVSARPACVAKSTRTEDDGLSTATEVVARNPEIGGAPVPTAAVPEPAPEPDAGLLDLTFSSLSQSKKAAAVAPPQPLQLVEQASPSRRTVQSIRVGADGKPVVAVGSDPLPEPAPLESSVPAAAVETPPEQVAAVSPGEAIEPLSEAPGLIAPIPMDRPTVRQTSAETGGTRLTVAGGGVNVRSGPSSSQPKLYVLAGGETVTVVDRQGRWVKVADDEGRSGWVDQDYVR
jgi:hypothetical protein